MLRLLNSLQGIHHGHCHWWFIFKRYAVQVFQKHQILFYSGQLYRVGCESWWYLNILRHRCEQKPVTYLLLWIIFWPSLGFYGRGTTHVGYAYRLSLFNLTYKKTRSKNIATLSSGYCFFYLLLIWCLILINGTIFPLLTLCFPLSEAEEF